MSDEWKIAQGLKKQNQNDSLSVDSIISEKRLKEFGKWQDEVEQQTWARNKRNLEESSKEIPDIQILDKEMESQNIVLLKECIVKCLQEHKGISGKIGDISFTIDEKNPQQISFIGENGNYNVTINGEDIFSEVDFYRYERPNYIKDGYAMTFIPMTRTITVTNGEEISESYRIEEIQDKNASKIIKDALNVYTDYTKGDEDELVRSDIDPNEEIRNVIKPIPAIKGLLEAIYHGKKVDLESGFYDYSRKPEKCKTYGEYAIPAQKIENNCRYLYSLVMEAYQSIENMPKKEKSHNNVQDTQETYKINEFGEIIRPDKAENTDITDKKMQENEDDSKLSNLSDEELDKFIEDMNAKQRENEQKIERLKKIKRAKELIALSKKQDKEIAELENQIQKEGIEFDE